MLTHLSTTHITLHILITLAPSLIPHPPFLTLKPSLSQCRLFAQTPLLTMSLSLLNPSALHHPPLPCVTLPHDSPHRWALPSILSFHIMPPFLGL